MEWYLKVLKQYADFSGRARRKEYWMFILFNIIVMFCLHLLMTWIFGIIDPPGKVIESGLAPRMSPSPFPTLIFMLYILATCIPTLAVIVRRLHDIGKSGWMLLVGLIPIVGTIWMFILLITDSQPGENEYGLNPKI